MSHNEEKPWSWDEFKREHSDEIARFDGLVATAVENAQRHLITAPRHQMAAEWMRGLPEEPHYRRRRANVRAAKKRREIQ
jgi:hypothetical protein